MSTSDVLVNCENINSKPKNISKKKVEGKKKDIPNGVASDTEVLKKTIMEELEEKPVIKTVLQYIYDKEELLELRSAPHSLLKPDCLHEDFFNKDGVWDPEAWHKSKSSRSASPAVADGKKHDMVEDNIELAPHRRSFKQGCQVQFDSDKSERSKPVFDRKNRLTGRAAAQRRSLETNYKDQSDLSERTHEFEKMRREREKFYDKDEKPSLFDRFTDKNNDRHYERDTRFDRNDFRKRERNDSYHSDKGSHNEKVSRHNNNYKAEKIVRKDSTEETLPEWMTDGPTSQLDTMEFTGFQDIEEEKKAYAKKKKKVRISPNVEMQEVKDEKHSKENKQPATQTSKKAVKSVEGKETSNKTFDINEFFHEVDYYPPHMFQEDTVSGDGVKSRFTQWFQAQSNGSRASPGSRPGSGPLIPDEIISGVPKKSPVMTVPYFTPIQPAPALVTAAANAHAMQTSNIMNIFQQQQQQQQQQVENTKANKEVKGRLSLKDLEKENEAQPAKQNEDMSKSAFNMLIMSMKEAGQLPDKPAPVVTGLPDHLLPQPPKRSSPTFEKLKRSLSRSPSPAQLMNAVSTVASIISSNPTLETKLAILQQKQNPEHAPQPPVTPKAMHPSSFVSSQQSFDTSAAVDSTANASTTKEQKRMPTAFTPTSVLKNIHYEKQRESPVLSQAPPDVSFIEPNKRKDYPDLLTETMDVRKLKISDDKKQSLTNGPIAITPDRSQPRNGHLPFHSAPTTPRNHLNLTVGAPPHSLSVPTTPDNRSQFNPPPIHRVTGHSSSLSPSGSSDHSNSAFTPTKARESVLLAPSAFQSSKQKDQSSNVGIIGSGIPQRSNLEEQRLQSERSRGFADPRLAPGNGATRGSRPFNFNGQSNPSLAPGMRPSNQSTPMPPQQPIQQQSQQQQLLHAQRMAQIQQAQLQQQQKLQQIANQANQQKLMQQQQHGKPFPTPSGIGPLLPDPDNSSQQPKDLRTPGEQRLHQQQQQQQIQAYQQQQQQLNQQQQPRPGFPNNNFRGNRSFQPPPNTRNSPPVPMPLQQPGLPLQFNRPQGIQNLAAQALVQQQLMTRARFLAQAQLLQQQPQVVQAALMAQAALARGQAQAQAAMMLNPRNLQAMAEQMGMRQPHNKAIPTPMVPNSQHGVGRQQGSVSSPTDNVLSKWFTPDILQNKPASELPSGKIMSVEELEKAQRSS